MTTAELVKKLLEAIAANDDALTVSIAVQAVDEAREEGLRRGQDGRRRRPAGRKAAEVIGIVR